MRDRQLEIIVRGKVGSGKTTMVTALKTMLEAFGHTVTVIEDEPAGSYTATIERMDPMRVIIRTEQVPR